MASMSSNHHSVDCEWDEDNEALSPEVMTAEVDPSMMTGEIPDRDGSELPIDMSEWTMEEVAAYNALRSKRKKCCIGGCTHRSLPIAKSYHQLPVRNEEIWKKWVEIIRWSRNDVEWSPNGDAAPLVCSRHFPDSDFISYEASSRVRLSHTAIPMHYINPPEGTDMDPRFSNPPPIPSASSINRQKDKPKQKKIKLDEYYNAGEGQINSNAFKVKNSPTYADNLGYDIEEVNDDSYDGYSESYEQAEEEAMPTFNYTQMRPNLIPGFSGVSKSAGNRSNARLSAPPSLLNIQGRSQVQNTVNTVPQRNKLPALIKADTLQANRLMIQRQSKSTPSKSLVVEGGLKSILNKDFQSSMVRGNGQNKHKIGLAKCRLIIQTLENQMRIAEIRLAEQLDIPVQVVRGVWNMRESLKEKL